MIVCEQLDGYAEYAKGFCNWSRVGIERVAVEETFRDASQAAVSDSPCADKHAPSSEIRRSAGLRQFDRVFKRLVEHKEVTFCCADVIGEA